MAYSKAVREWRNQAGMIERNKTPLHQFFSLNAWRKVRLAAAAAARVTMAEVTRVIKTLLPKSRYDSA